MTSVFFTINLLLLQQKQRSVININNKKFSNNVFAFTFYLNPDHSQIVSKLFSNLRSIRLTIYALIFSLIGSSLTIPIITHFRIPI